MPRRHQTLGGRGSTYDNRNRGFGKLCGEARREVRSSASSLLKEMIHSRLPRIASASVVQRQPNSPATVADRARLRPSSARADRATPRAVRSAEKRGPASNFRDRIFDGGELVGTTGARSVRSSHLGGA